jgi:murein DD-endopeptidase MepM/ murein hydrolase activator NlpD
MSRRAVKVGQYVKQGEIIGYVGQTGLATGPHVCYRFWVNGRQVDPYKQDLPDAEPMKESLKPSYFEFIKPLKIKIDEVDYKRIL